MFLKRGYLKLSRLEESTVKAKSLNLIGLNLIKREPNFGLEFQPCAATQIS